ncbi:MAG: F0F1 ATP synthase subunit A [Chloroflexota bacterium]|nr:F0F1 ATP synthase subunit A [Chloroflexota bacterium]
MEHGAHAVHEVALLRPANTDINVPLTLALVSFIAVEYWGITSLRLHYAGKFFRFGQLFQGLGHLVRGRIKAALGAILFGIIDIFVGLLELLSEFVRIISFTFRLFGNMTAGEVLLMMMAFLIAWVVPVLFYGLETLLGFIQALIFSSLTLVFATMAVTPHESEH